MDPAGIDLTAIVVTNGTLTSAAFTNSPETALDLVVTPDGGGDVSVSFGDGAFADLAGNPTAAAGPFSSAFDSTPPTPTITFETFDLITRSTIRITFDEDVTDFNVSDIAATDATVASFVTVTPGRVFTAVLTATNGLAPPSATIPAGAAFDFVGNPSLFGAAPTVPSPDGVAPTVTITGLPDNFEGPVITTVTFDWGEAVVGFDATDITVDGGTVGPLSGGPQIFTADISANGTSDLVLTIPAGAAGDATGTPTAAASARGRFASEIVTEELIRDFMTARATGLVAAQPDLRGLLDTNDATGEISVSKSRGVIQMSSRTNGLVWAMVDAQWSNTDAMRSSYTHLTFGSHLLRENDMAFGIMAQFDHAQSSAGAASVEGTGYLIGPYWVARFDDLLVDARLLVGQTENRISPTGTYTDEFDTDRWLAELNVTGQIEYDAGTLYPTLGLTVTEDRSETYIDSLSNPIAAQTVRLTELEVGLD